MISFIRQWGSNISKAIIATNPLARRTSTEHINIALEYIDPISFEKIDMKMSTYISNKLTNITVLSIQLVKLEKATYWKWQDFRFKSTSDEILYSFLAITEANKFM